MRKVLCQLAAVALVAGVTACSGSGGGSSSSSGGGGGSSGGGSSGASGGSSGASGGSSGASGGSSGASGGSSGASGGSSGASGGSSGASSSGGSSGASGSSSGGTGPAPAGDKAAACGAATALTLGTPANGTTVAGTNSFTGCEVSSIFGDYIYGADAADQVWSVTLTEAGGLRVVVDATFDSAIYLLSGASCATATAHNNNACADSLIDPGTETLEVSLLPAGTYYMVVDGYYSADTDEATSGTYSITATTVAGGICIDDGLDADGSANTLDDAYFVGATFADDMGAPNDVTLSLCGGTDEDWFTFYSSGGDFSVRAVPVAGWTGTTAVNLQSVARDAMGAPTGTDVTTGVTFAGGVLTGAGLPAGEYAAAITAMGGDTEYDFNVLWTCDPDGAEGQTGNSLETQAAGPVEGNIAAGAGAELSICPADVDNLWFRAAIAGTVTITVEGGAGFTVTAYDATVGMVGTSEAVTAVTPAAAATVANGGMGMADKVITWTATEGGSLVIKIEGNMSGGTGVPYRVAVAFPAPANDLCANAESVTLPAVGAAAVRVPGITIGANSETQETTAGCVSITRSDMSPQPEVFYTFTTGTTGVRLRAGVESPDYDSVLYLRTACTGGMELACNDDRETEPPMGVDEYTSEFEVALTADTTYTLVVDSWGGGGQFELVLETLALP